MNDCQYCKKTFVSPGTLKHHQKTVKYCIKIQKELNIEVEIKSYNCIKCEKSFGEKGNFDKHLKICKMIKEASETNKNIELEKLKKELKLKDDKILKLKEENLIFKTEFKTEFKTKDEIILKLEEKVNKLEDTIAKIAETPTTVNNNNVIEIEYDEDEKNEENEDDEDDEDEIDNNDEKYELKPLELGNNLSIENREEDGYINVTNLCKAGKKEFKAWNRLDKTKAFLRVLSNAVNISTASLIKYNTGYGSNQATWVHPQVAINIAQWISPYFDVKVSAWVYEIILTGKVDISSTKSYQQLQAENKDKELKIQMLTKKYVKSQPRQQIKDKNVIYILTTPSLKKERRYILGKAQDLTSRLSTYNKTDEHEIIYYQKCKDEESMGLVEKMIFERLKEYREQANRERFILPEKEKIELFIDEIKKCIEFI